MTIGDVLDTNFDVMPIAMFNFIKRRLDLFQLDEEMIKDCKSVIEQLKERRLF